MIVRNDYLLPGGRTGVLLIHGLTGTPTEMRGVAREFNRAGYTVYALQLAGHCGSVEDLVATRWQDWYQSVVDGANKLREHVDSLFVCGLSMGAVLALKYAAAHSSNIKGVIAYSVTFRYDGWSIPPLSRFAAPWLLPLAGMLNVGRQRMFNEEPPYGIRNEALRKKIADKMHSGDSAAAGLPGNPWSSLNEFLLLSRNVRRKLHHIRTPCLLMHAVDDDISHRRNAELVRDSVSGPVEMVLLPNSYHMITIDNDRRELFHRSIAFAHRYSDERSHPVPLSTADLAPVLHEAAL